MQKSGTNPNYNWNKNTLSSILLKQVIKKLQIRIPSYKFAYQVTNSHTKLQISIAS